MKFKVGDIIRGTKESDGKYYITSSRMTKGRVERVTGDIIWVRVLERNGSYPDMEYRVHSKYFELVKPETIVIYRHNDTVVAKNTQTGKKAVAKCHPDDEFDFNTGAAVAFDRLVGREEPKEEYYNGRVVCVNTNGMSHTTTGKIYEVVDGQFIDDGGNKRPSYGSFKFIEELNLLTLGTFIEVVE